MTRMSLAPAVERRPIISRPTVTFAVEYPPYAGNSDIIAQWHKRAAWPLLANTVGRVPGPVRITIELEKRPNRRLQEISTQAVIDLCVQCRVIDGDHQTIVRGISLKHGNVSGARVTVESAIEQERRSA